VLLVEQSVYHADILKAHIDQNQEETKKSKARKGIRENPDYPKATAKGYAEHRGLMRGSHGGTSDVIQADTYEVPIDENASDEGLYALVQALTCRRRILRLIYQNDLQGKYFSDDLKDYIVTH
jgi:hypothetical protein